MRHKEKETNTTAWNTHNRKQERFPKVFFPNFQRKAGVFPNTWESKGTPLIPSAPH